jgi:DNA-binding XRE family transcriptional regulator
MNMSAGMPATNRMMQSGAVLAILNHGYRGHIPGVSLTRAAVSVHTSPVSARETFAKVLRGYREQQGLTQEQAAKKLMLSLSLYKKIEGCERRPQSDFARRCDQLFSTPA